MTATTCILRRTLAGATVVLGILAIQPARAAGQDVELLGRMYGTPVPQGYYSRNTEPGAFEFSRALVGSAALAAPGRLGDPRLQGALDGTNPASVTGTFAVPVVLGLFSDSPDTPPHDAPTVQAHFFDGPNPTGTISDYYTEASNGRLGMTGVVFDWQRVTLSQNQVTGQSSGLGSGSRVSQYIVEVVAQLDSLAVDWGAFDNDGPDGRPNSGDDDGFVDVLAVLHPTDGAECSGDRTSDNRIWSHRWSIAPQLGSPYVTRTASASGGFIKVDDYTVQPVKACGGAGINQIGVFAHELGHGLGLPDLYAVGADHAAVGQWDLMATGSWGCPGVFNPARPCMMGAWSRAVLGWTDVVTLGFGADHGTVSLQPTSGGGNAYRVNTAGDDYYLLENRQPAGFNSQLPDNRGGLVIWHIDADGVAARWPSNSVNSDPDNQAVSVVQADGRNHLSRVGGGRGDAGDLYPGSDANTAFHAGSDPGSFTNEGQATGITILNIQELGQSIRARILSRYQTITVAAGGPPKGAGWVRVDNGVPLGSGDHFLSAPFQRHLVEALAGVPLSPGVRLSFQAWSDGAERSHTVTTGEVDLQLNATYSGREVELAIALDSEPEGVTPGTLVTEPSSADGWFVEGATVTVEARPRTGFAFAGWTGGLTTVTNPVTVKLDTPLTASARFDVTFQPTSVPVLVPAEGGQALEVILQTENANQPILWTLVSGLLPEGLVLQPGGRVVGVPLEPGQFPVSVRVVDGIGLSGQVDFTLEVRPPALAGSAIAQGFTPGSGTPTDGQRAYLDAQGNKNGVFDLGDFRAFLQAGLPLVAESGPVRVVLPSVRLTRRPSTPGANR